MTETRDPASLTGGLVDVLAPVVGAGVSVENLRELTGGASRTTWSFEAVTASQRRADRKSVV